MTKRRADSLRPLGSTTDKGFPTTEWRHKHIWHEFLEKNKIHYNLALSPTQGSKVSVETKSQEKYFVHPSVLGVAIFLPQTKLVTPIFAFLIDDSGESDNITQNKQQLHINNMETRI